MSTTVLIQSALHQLQHHVAACADIRNTFDSLAESTPLKPGVCQRIAFWLEILCQDAFAGEKTRARWVAQAETLGCDTTVRQRLHDCFERPRNGAKPREGLLELARGDLDSLGRAATLSDSIARQVDAEVVRFTAESERANAVRNELIDGAAERLRLLSRKILRRGPSDAQRAVETGDILSNASLRLRNALCDVSPLDPRAFFGLAALQVRRELTDIGRRLKAERAKKKEFDPSGEEPADPRGTSSDDFAIVECWTRLHEAVERLPAARKEVFDLHWYQGCTLEEVAQIVNRNIDTVKKRLWRPAREQIAAELGDCASVLLGA